jgi:hypothetical protein
MTQRTISPRPDSNQGPSTELTDRETDNEYIHKFASSPDNFANWITETRFFVVRGFWLNGAKPIRPSFEGLPIWKIKWLQNQKKLATYHAWLADGERRAMAAKRHKDKGNLILARRLELQERQDQKERTKQERRDLEYDLKQLKHDQQLPIVLSPLAEFWLALKKAKVAA